MGLSYDEALRRLATVRTADELTALILEIEINPPADRTVLFSGPVAAKGSGGLPGLSSLEVARGLTAWNPQLVMMSDLPIGRFLDRDIQSSTFNESLAVKLDEIFKGNDTKIAEFFYGTRAPDGSRLPTGLWDKVSARLARAAQGDVITISAGARLDSVFAQTELPALLANPKVTRIDGIPISLLRRIGVEEAFRLITATSELAMAHLHLVLKADGSPLRVDGRYRIDGRAFPIELPAMPVAPLPMDGSYRLVGELIPLERFRAHRETVISYRSLLAAERARLAQPHQIQERLGISRILGRLDRGLVVLGLAITALEAQEALNRGDRAGAQAILSRWARESVGAIVGGQLAALLASPLVAAGPIGALLAGGLVLAGSVGGAQLAGGAPGEAAQAALLRALATWNDETIALLKRLFQFSEGYGSPLVLDLDGLGVATLPLLGRGVQFDHDNNGFAERSGWVGAGDGLLVRDLDGNGRITGGAELFGNNTRLPSGRLAANGFEALRGLDGNGDGRITAADGAWRDLRVWLDADADAITDPGELLSLAQAGVAALPLAFTSLQLIDANGNAHRQVGCYQRSDGSLRACHDVWFAMDPTLSTLVNPLPIPAAIAALPDLPGMGIVASLHQVMAANPASPLPALLEQWSIGSSDQRAALITPIIQAWTGVDGPVPASWQGDPADHRRLRALEALMGRPYRGVAWTAMPQLSDLLATFLPILPALARELDLLLSAQVDLLPLVGWLSAAPTSEGGGGPDVSQMLRQLESPSDRRPDSGLLCRITANLQRLGPTGSAILKALDQALRGRSDPLAVLLRPLLTGPQWQLGSQLNETLSGGAERDWLDGGGGADSLLGGAGEDALLGGGGDDTLVGGSGADRYLVFRGEGRDRIQDCDDSGGATDTLIWLGVNASEVVAERVGSDLVLRTADGEAVEIVGQFSGVRNRLETVQFADGSLWGDSDLLARLRIGGATPGPDKLGGFSDIPNRIDGLAGHDLLTGGPLADALLGGADNDTLIGQAGNDRLSGGSGDDSLIGGPGDDTLIADAGNDSLYGEGGSDTYLISRSTSRASLWDFDTTPAIPHRDSVVFPDLLPADLLAVERLGSNLRFRFGSGLELSVLNHFASPAWRIESVQFADGSLWGDSDLLARLRIGGATPGPDQLGGFSDIPNRIDGLAGHDLLTGGPLADALLGGDGNDTLIGQAGNDRLSGGSGDDSLIGGPGDDTLVVDAGNDSLYDEGGSDTYLISRSARRASLWDLDSTPAIPHRDRIVFTDLLPANLLAVERFGSNLRFRFGSGLELSVLNHFSSPAWRIESVQFADGSLWGEPQIARLVGA